MLKAHEYLKVADLIGRLAVPKDWDLIGDRAAEDEKGRFGVLMQHRLTQYYGLWVGGCMRSVDQCAAAKYAAELKGENHG